MKKCLSFILAALLLLSSFVGCQSAPANKDDVDAESFNIPDTSETPADPFETTHDSTKENDEEKVTIGTDSEPKETTDSSDSSKTYLEATYDPIKEYDEEQVIVVDEETNTGFLVKSKKFPQSNNGTDTLILSVENCTEKNYTIRIKVEFFDAEGNRIRTRRKSFKGFPAGWQNFFIFLPEVNYETMTCTIDTTEYTEPTYAQHILANAVPANLYILRAKARYYPTYEVLDDWYIELLVDFQAANVTCEETLYVPNERVLFDNQGKIFAYYSRPDVLAPLFSCIGRPPEEYLREGYSLQLEVSDVLWEDREDYIWPENLTGELIGIFSVLGVFTESE